MAVTMVMANEGADWPGNCMRLGPARVEASAGHAVLDSRRSTHVTARFRVVDYPCGRRGVWRCTGSRSYRSRHYRGAPVPITPEFTTFSLDIPGRYLCNDINEVLLSAGVKVGQDVPPTDARPFDVVVIGGGTFASVVAQHLLFTDVTRSRRVLVIDRGPFVLAEHQQNLPFMDGGLPDFIRPWDKTFSGGNPGLRLCLGGRSLEWGGWSPEPLDAELGVGWPEPVIKDLTEPVTVDGTQSPGYYQQASDQLGVTDTNDFIYGELHEALREQLRLGLNAAQAAPGTSIAANLPLSSLPDHPRVRFNDLLKEPDADDQLRALLNLPATDTHTTGELRDLLRLEAPLAIQTRADPGKFPVNKFSALPLLMTASRQASIEALPFDQLKRLMVLPGWHVQELITTTLPDNSVRVTEVQIVRGWNGVVSQTRRIPLSADGAVIIAVGTVESTRLAKQTFQQSLAQGAASRMGTNLQAHLRSNLTIRVPRTSIPHLSPVAQALEVSALFVKGRITLKGRDRHFHLQITASGLEATGSANSEEELFKKIPDLDQLARLRRGNDTNVVFTLRGIGEMCPENKDSGITLAGQGQDFERTKALVSLGDSKAYAEKPQDFPDATEETKLDAEVWAAMDTLADEVALIFAGGEEFEILPDATSAPIKVAKGATVADLANALPNQKRRDGLGTTHHEAGPMWLGGSDKSVSDEFGRVRGTVNCFSAGPMLFPSLGSPNPMLTGVALARRTVDHLSRRLGKTPPTEVLPRLTPFTGDGPDWQVLFDGTLASFVKWKFAGVPGGAAFKYVDGRIHSVGAGEMGLLYYPVGLSDFALRLEFRVFEPDTNSGVFLRFRDPRKDLPEPVATWLRHDPDAIRGNPAWKAVFSGFEVQIDDKAVGDKRPHIDFYGMPEPDGLRKNRTGAIYKIPAGDPIPGGGQDKADQTYTEGPALLPRPWDDEDGWYSYEITVKGDDYQVRLGRAGKPDTQVVTSTFTNNVKERGVPNSTDGDSGFIGLQSYSGKRVSFRNIQIKTTI